MLDKVKKILKKYEIEHDKVTYHEKFLESNNQVVFIYNGDSAIMILDTEIKVKNYDVIFDKELEAVMKIMWLLKK